ncbi:HlyD family secretion protein [Rufibacter glacialis]|uniref:HlyD family efflux transporter periplasmic adaptor subunit n=1 Tax=Rufibacter glacialis TaxID=1259555 RepID=A0A5M8QKJ4_9BACT|nr:HlyD family efflux transporter periplasmic adaptor subunit [Rufibacter glacialis]KAA6435671.1 HlyD family efflux transporter periplasmic adaptor subunit [Rufibacter glacialis]GGK65403.1 biotin attachment protein [Rufibacter glacialis]
MAKQPQPQAVPQAWEQFDSFRLLSKPRLAKVMAYWCIGLFGLLFVASWFPWTQNIRSAGSVTTLQPQDRPQTVQSTIAGRIEQWRVQEGQTVKKGDTLVTLSEVKEKYFDPQLLARIGEQLEAKEGSLQANQEKADALNAQIAALQEGLQFSLQKARNKISQARLKIQSDSADLVAITAEYAVAEAQYARQEKLFQQGLKSLTELESRRLKFQEMQAKRQSMQNKLSISRNEQQNARLELSSLNAEYQDKISKARSDLNATLAYLNDTRGEISKVRNEYANTQIRNSFYQITAPQDGVVVRTLKAGIGETMKEGEVLCSIMPSNPALAVQLYVDPMDIPLLDVGRNVRLQFEGWPALVFSGWPNVGFGTFGGKVAVIDNLDSQGKYRILVVPDPQDTPWPQAIRMGSGAYGWAMLNDVPIWYELWRQMNAFPPDYLGAGEKAAKEGKEAKTGTEGGDK